MSGGNININTYIYYIMIYVVMFSLDINRFDYIYIYRLIYVVMFNIAVV